MQKSSEMAVRQATGTHLICADLQVPGVLVHVESGHGEMRRDTQVVTWPPWEGPLSHGLGIELTKNHRWRDILGVSIALPVQRWQSWSWSYQQPTANPAFWCQQSLFLPGVLSIPNHPSVAQLNSEILQDILPSQKTQVQVTGKYSSTFSQECTHEKSNKNLFKNPSVPNLQLRFEMIARDSKHSLCLLFIQ